MTTVLDYPEYLREPGLNLQCTPGNDVECVTAQVGAGANIVFVHHGPGNSYGKSHRACSENFHEFAAGRKNAGHY